MGLKGGGLGECGNYGVATLARLPCLAGLGFKNGGNSGKKA